MVNDGKTNAQIYQYISDNYGKNQVAIPRQGWFNRISYGLPFLLMGGIVILVLGYAWNWSDDEDDSDSNQDSNISQEKADRIERAASEGGPLN